jgi:hypothetical protein
MARVSQPSTRSEGRDVLLLQRLRRAFWATADGGRYARSIRVTSPVAWPDSVDHYEQLVRAIAPADSSARMLAGWWEGWADSAASRIGRSGSHLAVEPATDLDWIVWNVAWPEVKEIILATHHKPGVMAPEDPGWVLFSPPSSNDLFLYPELSASD